MRKISSRSTRASIKKKNGVLSNASKKRRSPSGYNLPCFLGGVNPKFDQIFKVYPKIKYLLVLERTESTSHRLWKWLEHHFQ